MTDTYDLITLGAGSGGVAAARRAALHGARVAIVEGRGVGGTCVLRGCVPKKLLMYAAQFGDAFAEARGFGWTLEPPKFEMARWAEAKAAETSRLEGIYRRLLDESGVMLHQGWARLEEGTLVAVGERRLRADKVIIATGSSPVTDSIPGIELCATSDDLLDLAALPTQAAVVGAGFIAVEFSSMLARLGVEVSLYFRDSAPLRGFDESLRSHATDALRAAGVQIHAGMVPTRISPAATGLQLQFADGRERIYPWTLNATGRRPNTQGLGLQVDSRGAIPVDSALQTARPGVYAIGDVTNRKNLTPVAIAEGRMLADALFGQASHPVDLACVPSAVFMLPPLASVGPTEEQALAAGHRLRVYETSFRPMKQALGGRAERTHMKLLVEDGDDKVLAAHMFGADAPEIIQALAVALTAGATKSQVDKTLAMHPTAAEEFVLMREPARVLGLPAHR